MVAVNASIRGFNVVDIADRAQIEMEKEEALRIKEIRQKAAAIPTGNPGNCEICGEWSGRLVGGACAPCRDRLSLP